tara:strand:+ start:152300 stop:153046 length:747 start_codon:yes stop_codon:yes gene_type:complete
MKKTLLSLFLIATTSLFAQSFTTGTQTLLTGLTAEVVIDGPSNTTTLTLEGPSNAWFAIGFGGLNMSAGADVFRTDGTTIVDARATGRFLPSSDSSQDWSLVSNTVSGSTRTIVATRANNTGDSDDFIFNPAAGSLSVIYAHGSSTTYAYHGGTRGFTTLGVTLGISENKLLSFKMFPNPASDLVNIQLPSGSDKAEVSIFDYTGRLMKSKTITSNDSKLDVNNLSNGMYLIRVTSNNKIGAQRFIKN